MKAEPKIQKTYDVGLLVLFVFGLYLYGFSSWQLTAVCVVAMQVFRRQRSDVLIAANMMMWCFSEHLEWGAIFAKSSEPLSFLTQAGLKGCILFLVVGFFGLYFKICQKHKKHIFFFQFAALAILCVFTILYFYWDLSSQLSLSAVFGAGLILIFARFFWYILFVGVEQAKGQVSFRAGLASLVPFWTDTFLPVPGGVLSLQDGTRETDDFLNSERKLKLAAVKCLYLACLLKGLYFYIIAVAFGRGGFFFGPLHLKNIMRTPYEILNAENFSLAQGWGSLVVSLLLWIMYVKMTFDVIVSIAWMSGFNIRLNTTAMFKADSVSGYWSRFLHYYSRLLMVLFFTPFRERLRFLNSGRLSAALAVFFAVFLGGFLFHITFQPWMTNIQLNVSYEQHYKSYLSGVPYFFALAVLVSLPLLSKKKRSTSSAAWRLPKFLLFLLIHMVLMSLVSIVFAGSTWGAYLTFLRSLFGVR